MEAFSRETGAPPKSSATGPPGAVSKWGSAQSAAYQVQSSAPGTVSARRMSTVVAV